MSELDWQDIKYTRWIDMLRLYNRIIAMKPHRWPKRIWYWDVQTNIDAWYSDTCFILNYVVSNFDMTSNALVDMEVANRTMMSQARRSWALEATTKRKLRTYVKINDFESPGILIQANIPRHQRSLMTKLKTGVLPI